MSLQPALLRKSRPLLPALVALALLSAGAAHAAEIRVVSSGGFAQAYRNLAADYERASGDHLVSEWGPSMGTTAKAIPTRLARGEPIDVVIMVGDALDKLMAEGKLAAGTKVVLADSPIACAVRRGAPKPDISTTEGLRNAFLKANKVAYSDSASGVYIETQLMKKLGIVEQMQGKAAKIPATPVGEIVAHGQADFGCQQRSELMPVEGIEIVGLLPADVQQMTEFSAALVRDAKQPEAGRALLKFLSSPEHAGAIEATGLVPAAKTKQ